jgi:hypothetical protein
VSASSAAPLIHRRARPGVGAGDTANFRPAARPHDRIGARHHRRRRALFHHVAPQPLTTVDILGGGKAALVKANTELGLACPTTRSTTWSRTSGKVGRNPTDVELMMFAQANSEHCRHKIFNASWTVMATTSRCRCSA